MVTGFPYDNVVAGVLVLLVGFVFHFGGQGLSLINWDLATRLGLQEHEAPPEFKVYEHGIATADVLLGWVYGVAGAGLVLGTAWGYKLAFIPGAILTYHALSFWFWTGNSRRFGVRTAISDPPARITWFLANILAGLLALFVAWNGT